MNKPSETSTTWLWALLLAVELVVYGGHYVAYCFPEGRICDFYQDWQSVQFLLQGQSIYSPLAGPAERMFRGVKWADLHYGAFNPHPPAAILACCPPGMLPYAQGAMAWNLVSVYFVLLALMTLARESGVAVGLRQWIIGLALLLPASPMLQQVFHAQNNGVALLLIVMAWAAQRKGFQDTAGICLGLATALKLIPGLLFLFFLLKRQRRAVAVGVAAFLAAQAVAWLILGSDEFLAFLRNLGPHTARFRAGWLNSSLVGLFARLFEPSAVLPGHVPLRPMPYATEAAAYGCGLLLVAATAWRQRLALTPPQNDLAFGLWTTAMLLVSPLTWDHYLLLAMPALFLLWRWLPEGAGWATAYAAVVFLLWLHPILVWEPLIDGGFERGRAQPWQSLTLISYKHWGLWLLYALQWAALKRPGGRREPRAEDLFSGRSQAASAR